jgi:hypothetical protein
MEAQKNPQLLYYHQVMMQLGVTGLTWCCFFVWLCDENHFEVIEFDEEE